MENTRGRSNVGEKGYVAVVGGVNIDIGGKPFQPLIAKDSNPGRVSISLGGVGRNIAHNMALLGLDVRFLTAFGDDLYARQIEDSCISLGIDISCARKISGGITSTYIFLSEADGDMAMAVSDMEICEQISPAYLAANLTLINNARVVVADGNLSENSLQYLASHCTVPLFVDPVSVAKAKKLKGILSSIHTFKPNRIEAEALSGIPVSDVTSACTSAEKLLESGMRRVFLSLGSRGVLAADRNEAFFQESFPAAVRNTTGAGDAFMAALVWAYLKEMDLRGSTMAASAAAAIATESKETINPALSEETLRARMNNIMEE
ncbi:MAG: carbohydrate kinase family protein [Oscillospiraceae bacterium]|nr:carbohydrate kinase family protein [Oscillospiraceae bacterium]